IRDCAAGPESHVVVASGEIDLHAAPSLREMLNVASERKPRDLVLDMSAATFLDSAAIGVLAGHIRAAGESLRLVCTNENVLRILEVSGLARGLTIHATVEDESIHVWVTEDDDRLTLGVRDAGVFTLEPPPDDPLPEFGRGLMMMGHLVDGVALSRMDGHTHVELSMQRAA